MKPPRIDRAAFEVTSFDEADRADRAYWHQRTPLERLAALELMRSLNYDYDPATDRLQRVIEVVERT